MLYTQFIDLAERYYKPNEPLPSGKTPYQKAKASAQGPKKTPAQRHPLARLYTPPEEPKSKERRQLQQSRLGKVRRGSRNPHFDFTPHKDLEITHYHKFSGGKHHYSSDVYNDREDQKYVRQNPTFKIRHKPTGIDYHVTKNRKTGEHSIEWWGGHADQSGKTIARNAAKVWQQHIEPRFAHGTVLHNNPVKKKLKKAYQRFGFGDTDKQNNQYAKVGNPKSPRQMEKNKNRPNRLTPINP